MEKTVSPYFKFALLVILAIIALMVTQQMWTKQIGYKLSGTRQHQVTFTTNECQKLCSSEYAKDTPVNDSRLKLTSTKPNGALNSEDMPDRWCQYMRKINRVNQHPYKFLTTAESLCFPDAPFMVIIVPSVCENVITRRSIRKTWGSVVHTRTWPDGQKLPTIKLAFLFGFPKTQVCSEILKNETTKYEDIIVSDFTDSYRNFTLKSLSALKWVSEYCLHVHYVMKCDEDTFVHIPRLVKLIRDLNFSNTLIGRLIFDKQPRTSGRWEVSANQYPFRRYPTYLHGQVYIIPGKIIPKLFQISEYFDFIPLEDAFVTGILARCAGATLCEKSPSGYFNPWKIDWIKKHAECYFYQGLDRISLTELNTTQLEMLWGTFNNNAECFRLFNKTTNVKITEKL